MEKETSSPSLPAAIGRLAPVWQAVWHDLPHLVSYPLICSAFGFKNAKTASAAISSDPDAPEPIFIGRAALFDRTALILWAANRAANARHRGCKARSGGE